jgi:hypothetical protein
LVDIPVFDELYQERSSLLPKKILGAAEIIDSGYFQLPDQPADLETLINVLQSDGKIRQALELPVKMAISDFVEYQHESSKIEKFVNELFFERKNYKKWWDSILSARWAGVSCSYVLTQMFESNIIIEDIITFDPMTFIPSNGLGVKKVLIQGKGGKELTIPREQCIVYTFGSQFGNPYGESLLNYVYKHFNRKEECAKGWLGYLRRFSHPVTIMWVEKNCPDKEIEVIRPQLQSLTYNNQMIIPRGVNSDGTPSKQLEFIEVNRGGADFKDFYQTMDSQISVALGLPELIFNASAGTYSLGKVQEKTLEISVTGVKDMLTEVTNTHMLRPLLKANFDEDKPGKLVFKALDGRDLREEASAILDMHNSGLIYGQEVGKRLGIPVAKEAYGLREASKADPQRGNQDEINNQDPKKAKSKEKEGEE